MSEVPSFFQECVNAVLDGVEVDLAKVGFARAGPDLRWKQGRWSRSFVRTGCAWKNDRVDVIYPRSSSDFARTEIEIRVGVDLKDGEGQTIPYDGVTVSFLVRRERMGYRVPRWAVFKDYRQRKFREDIRADLAKSLSWFDELGTVEACSMRLKTGETNHAGPNWEGGPALRMLESWQVRG
jgi:hypothetical protein